MTEPSGIEFHDRVPAPSGRSTGGRAAMVAGAVAPGRGRRRRRHGRVGAFRHRRGSERERPARRASVAPASSPSPTASLEPRTTCPIGGNPLARRRRPAGRARAAGGAGTRRVPRRHDQRDQRVGHLAQDGRRLDAHDQRRVDDDDHQGRRHDHGRRPRGRGRDPLRPEEGGDGSYEVTAIVVVLPTIAGEVTAVGADTIQVTQPGGTTATIHVDSHTTYRIDGASGSLAGVKVGSFLIAEGTQRTDGSLDAAAIRRAVFARALAVAAGRATSSRAPRRRARVADGPRDVRSRAQVRCARYVRPGHSGASHARGV